MHKLAMIHEKTKWMERAIGIEKTTCGERILRKIGIPTGAHKGQLPWQSWGFARLSPYSRGGSTITLIGEQAMGGILQSGRGAGSTMRIVGFLFLLLSLGVAFCIIGFIIGFGFTASIFRIIEAVQFYIG